MSVWLRQHLDETVTATVAPEGGRFLVHVREPVDAARRPIDFLRWSLKEAQAAADELVQAYYPHECDARGCGPWLRAEE
jgi:hypothetical protein